MTATNACTKTVCRVSQISPPVQTIYHGIFAVEAAYPSRPFSNRNAVRRSNA
jgi:hypothetical protein